MWDQLVNNNKKWESRHLMFFLDMTMNASGLRVNGHPAQSQIVMRVQKIYINL